MYYALAVVLVLILDQWLKYWVTINIVLNTGSRELIPGIVSLVNIHNSGAAFGILDSGDWRWAFVAIAVVFTAFAVYALKKGLIQHAIGRWAMVGVLAGAIGNCIDRVLFGYVVDMFKLEFMNYAIFNVADMFISCCGVLFCLYIIFSGSGKKAEAAEAEASGDHSRRNAKSARGAAAKARPRGGESAAEREERPAPARFERAKDDARTYTPRKAGEAAAERSEAPRKAPARPASAAQAAAWTRSEAASRPTPQAPAGGAPAQAAPFAEWEKAAASAPPAEKKPAGNQKKDGEEFSLEDILAECGSK